MTFLVLLRVQSAMILLLLLLAGTLSAQTWDLVIGNGRVIDPESGLDAVRWVGIRGRTIEFPERRPKASLWSMRGGSRLRLALSALSQIAKEERRGHCNRSELRSDTEDRVDELALGHRMTLSDPADLTLADACIAS